MSIEIPNLPQQPGPDAPWEQRMQWAQAATQRALVQATAKLAESQAGMLLIAQQQLQHGQRLADLFAGAAAAAAPAPAGAEGARTVVAALLGETERPPAEVAQSVQARLTAVDSMLGAVPPAPAPHGGA